MQSIKQAKMKDEKPEEARKGQRYYFTAGVERLFGVQSPLSLANVHVKLTIKSRACPSERVLVGGDD